MPEPDEFTSDTESDYTKLRDLLVAGQWQEADEETGVVMLKITHRVSSGWITEEDIVEFPSKDLKIIDSLWVRHSKSRFGFSVQSLIWERVGEDYLRFSDAVGWRVDYKWQHYSQLVFGLEAAIGHLPAAPFFTSNGAAIGWAASLPLKLEDCYADDF
ncbi:hypothetical protein NUACC21_63840 [Scytonema sp. NUACC21]